MTIKKDIHKRSPPRLSLKEKRRRRANLLEGQRNRDYSKSRPHFPPRSDTPISKSFFHKDKLYWAQCMGGQDPSTLYRCVYVGDDLVIFVFKYQGIERSHYCYIHSTKVGDYVTVTDKRTEHFYQIVKEI